MAGDTPYKAVDNYIKPLREALQCVTRERLLLRERRSLELNKTYAVSLKDGDPVTLHSTTLALRIGQQFQVVRREEGDERGPYKVTTVSYVYQFSDRSDHHKEVLAFHWTPEDPNPAEIKFPHLHIGPALLANQQVIRSRDLHKAHIPTGRVSLESIIRLAISEFRARSLKDDWQDTLEKSEQAFLQWKTR